jgi:hypothetical protein
MIFALGVTITTYLYTGDDKKEKVCNVSVNQELDFVELSFSGKLNLSL